MRSPAEKSEADEVGRVVREIPSNELLIDDEKMENLNIGRYPPEYNRAIHGPYDPARYYGKRELSSRATNGKSRRWPSSLQRSFPSLTRFKKNIFLYLFIYVFLQLTLHSVRWSSASWPAGSDAAKRHHGAPLLSYPEVRNLGALCAWSPFWKKSNCVTLMANKNELIVFVFKIRVKFFEHSGEKKMFMCDWISQDFGPGSTVSVWLSVQDSRLPFRSLWWTWQCSITWTTAGSVCIQKTFFNQQIPQNLALFFSSIWIWLVIMIFLFQSTTSTPSITNFKAVYRLCYHGSSVTSGVSTSECIMVLLF